MYQDDEKKVEVLAEGHESEDFIAKGRSFRDLYATDEKINKPAIWVGVIEYEKITDMLRIRFPSSSHKSAPILRHGQKSAKIAVSTK